MKVVQDRSEKKKKRKEEKRKENPRNQGRFKSFRFCPRMRIFLIAHEVSRAEGRDPLTTALTPSEQSGLTQFLVQFARGTRVCLKPTEMKMDQKEKEEREREGKSKINAGDQLSESNGLSVEGRRSCNGM